MVYITSLPSELIKYNQDHKSVSVCPVKPGEDVVAGYNLKQLILIVHLDFGTF